MALKYGLLGKAAIAAAMAFGVSNASFAQQPLITCQPLQAEPALREREPPRLYSLEKVSVLEGTQKVVASFSGGRRIIEERIDSARYGRFSLANLVGIDKFPKNTEIFLNYSCDRAFADIVVPGARAVIRAVETGNDSISFQFTYPNRLPQDDSLIFPARMAVSEGRGRLVGGCSAFLTHKGALLLLNTGESYYFRIKEKAMEDMETASIGNLRAISSPYDEKIGPFGQICANYIEFSVSFPSGGRYYVQTSAIVLEYGESMGREFSKIPEHVTNHRNPLEEIEMLPVRQEDFDFNSWHRGNKIPLEFWLKMHGLDGK